MFRWFFSGLLIFIVFLISPAASAAPGDTIRSIASPFDCPQGLTFDGKYLWNADRKSDMLYKIDPKSGEVADSIPTPGYVVRGLTWDGKLLWCVDAAEELIYAINPKNKIVEKTIYCPSSRPGDLAWDGKYLWLADDRENEICQLSPEDGTTIVSIPAPTSTPGGLTFDGTYLWVADRYRDEIYMVSPDNGDVVISFDAPGPHAWGLAWDGKNLWNVDYQADRIYKLVVDNGTLFDRTEEKAERVEFILQARNYGPDSVKTLDVYLAIPHDMNNQELIGEVVFEPKPDKIITDKWDQKIALFQFKDMAAAEFAEITMTAEAKLYQNRYFVFPEKVGTLDDIPKDIRDKYLVDDAKFDLDNDIIQKAVKAAVGDETNPYRIGRKIFNYVIDHIEYELAGGWNIAPAVLERGTGSCSEYSFVYIAVCRAAGLPARYVGSIVIRGDDASWDETFHRWVEIYLPGYGWLPVDPSGGDAKWGADKARSFGFLRNRFLITTAGGGGSEYLEWGYNANAKATSIGRCKVDIEYFGEWTPLELEEEEEEKLLE